MTVSKDRSMIHKVTRIGSLFDFYSGLLTERQRAMVELHYLEDWSLGEIANQFGISRQAVHDNLRRAEEQLEYYEQVLHLFSLDRVQANSVAQVLAVWQSIRSTIPQDMQHRMDEALALLQSINVLVLGRDDNA